MSGPPSNVWIWIPVLLFAAVLLVATVIALVALIYWIAVYAGCGPAIIAATDTTLKNRAERRLQRRQYAMAGNEDMDTDPDTTADTSQSHSDNTV